MSEATSPTKPDDGAIKIGKGIIPFVFDQGRQFEADAIQLERDIFELWDASVKANETHYAYLDKIVAYVKEKFQLAIALGEAECLTVKATEASIRQKKFWSAPTLAMRGSASSMESTSSPED